MILSRVGIEIHKAARGFSLYIWRRGFHNCSLFGVKLQGKTSGDFRERKQPGACTMPLFIERQGLLIHVALSAHALQLQP